ncbi:MAG: tetratricopeptide repeat protein, partial [Aliifodinibius sp.]|nr:tetratricopeptide repeat protein [Fodinibius sp.]NIV12067.1 tetratricopeptide repeat protein [Fodinibius sp.]NIV99224.1 tetratricopeptide repeat protein [Candidatus Saccharibacteria bacterium]NIY26217.1 tetratricopeptide repeat protein [Fodinibius sp.]
AHHWLGLIATVTNDYNDALKHFNRAAELKPYSEEPWLHMEMTYRRKEDTKSA